jgi:hypothetical protein
MSDNPLDPSTDPFKPPAIPTAVSCLHCGEEFDSYLIEWRVETDKGGSPMGFWCCPTPGCDGKGFGFDIFPLDPDYLDENGDRMWSSDEEEDDDIEEFDDFEGNDGDESHPSNNGDEKDIPF